MLGLVDGLGLAVAGALPGVRLGVAATGSGASLVPALEMATGRIAAAAPTAATATFLLKFTGCSES